ncbi:MAG TPA: alkaline phosphatase family protein [Solirubrobacteraceae bacterium]|nr:alkaline phosphatase family protein [Solirubrobacteraceae bacterium]
MYVVADMGPVTTRRELLRGAAGGAALGMTALASNSLIARALASAPGCASSLSDIEHFVILIQENRSFDHYFGTYRGVTGFADPHALALNDGSGLSVFAQPGYPGGYKGGHLYPFHIDSSSNGECTNDINHSWGPQHTYWDGGRMDGFVTGHLQADGPANGPLTMGYYTRNDLQFYYALADAFTVCDHYYCSVIGPTDPNRLYSFSAWLDPTGTQGGPILSTSTSRVERFGTLSWTTMPEQLQARGISWKVYGSADGNYGDNVLPYFRQYQTNPTLQANALVPSYPGTFQTDVAAGTLPQVSWVLAPLIESEHPPAPTEFGEVVAADVLNTLVSNPAIWAKTALLINYDENGGFFDHVPPPVPAAGTAGEFLSVNPLPSDASGVAGPIGLGFRVPMLVVSPFSRGGFVCSDVFDHTSTLRLLETRFGVEVPNLSSWRRSSTGDMTTAFNFAKVDASVPSLPQPSTTDSRVTSSSCAVGAPLDLASPSSTTLDQLEATVVPPYPITVNSKPPAQEPGKAPAPSGPVCGSGAKKGQAGTSALRVRGVRVHTSGRFHGTIAHFSYTDTSTPASSFSARIHWGNGRVSMAKIVGGGGAFRVIGKHHFAKAGRHRVRITVTAPNGAHGTATSVVTVAHHRAGRPPRPLRRHPSFTE